MMKYLLVLASFFVTTTTFAAVSLSQLQNNYQDAKSKFTASTHKNPLLIKDIIARRFINLPDWNNYKTKAVANGEPIDLRFVYKPAPITWDKWQVTALGLVQAAADAKKELTFEELMRWHKSALSGELAKGINAGELKVSANYGSNVKKSWSLTVDEINNINNFKFSSDSKVKLKWTELVCQEDLGLINNDLPEQTQLLINKEAAEFYRLAEKFAANDKIWNEAKDSIAANDLFQDAAPYWPRWFWFAVWPRKNSSISDPSKRCGMIHYPPSDQVETILRKQLDQINKYFKAQFHAEDAVAFAIRMQRELAALHPFQDGNGRMSRFVMDYITLRSGLPTIFIPDMNNDYSASFDQYYAWATSSIQATTKIISDCQLLQGSLNEVDYQNSSCGFTQDGSIN